MTTLALHSGNSRLATLLSLLFALLATACGLNEQEQAVANANTVQEHVREARSAVETAIAGLGEDRDPTAFRDSLVSYMERLEELSGALRAVAESNETMQTHFATEFLPASEEAMSLCQSAVTALEAADDINDQELRQLTLDVARCMNDYSEAYSAAARTYQDSSGS